MSNKSKERDTRLYRSVEKCRKKYRTNREKTEEAKETQTIVEIGIDTECERRSRENATRSKKRERTIGFESEMRRNVSLQDSFVG